MNNQVKHIMAIRAAILGISLLVLICVPFFAFLGALGATTIIYLLFCQTGAKSNAVYIVLAGVAISNLLSALTSAMMALNTDALEVTYSWLLGSLSGRTWSAVNTILPYSIVGLCRDHMVHLSGEND